MSKCIRISRNRYFFIPFPCLIENKDEIKRTTVKISFLTKQIIKVTVIFSFLIDQFSLKLNNIV